MARKHEGFTVAIIPHSAHGKGREFRITGARIPVFRALVVLVALIVAGAVYLLAFGALRHGREEALNQRIAGLSDSLSMAMDIDYRLEMIEMQLEEIRAIRRVIENLATQGAPSDE
jgi:hypothetical protein